MALIAYKQMLEEAAQYLEASRQCSKHHVEHTGSLCYLLDFYDALGEIEKGKKHVDHLLSLVVEQGSTRVFYPGHINPMNMSQNVIDTGSAVDAIARFARKNKARFSDTEHEHIKRRLREVVDSYLVAAATEKQITNHRLWGLTGLAAFARYVGEEDSYRSVVQSSIAQAFKDMSPDGFFWYVPRAKETGIFEGYNDISSFYQSRCLAFIRYSADCVGLSLDPWKDSLEKSEKALVSLYFSNGIKDMGLECKKWYWLSSYEVAASGFDSFALSCSSGVHTPVLLRNVVYQARKHFHEGRLRSHEGAQHNFQCSIFWTAHMAWLIRIPEAAVVWDSVDAVQSFAYQYKGEDFFADTNPGRRVFLNTHFGARNPTVGVYTNGLPRDIFLALRVPRLPPRLLFSIREFVNHTWCALRGGHFAEALSRSWRMAGMLAMILAPLYSVHWGKVESWNSVTGQLGSKELVVDVYPGSLYGTLLSRKVRVRLPL